MDTTMIKAPTITAKMPESVKGWSSWRDAYSGNNVDAGGVVTGAIGMVTPAIQQYNSIKDSDSFDGTINSLQLSPDYGYGNLSTLKDGIMNYNRIKNVTARDMGYDSNRSIAGTLSSAVSGASAGSSFGPIGTAVGGALGLLTGFFGDRVAHNKAIREANETNAMINKVNNFNESVLNSNLEATKAENIFNSIYNSDNAYAAYGGPLQMKQGLMTPFGKRFDVGGGLHTQGSDWSNGIIAINEGLSHEANPNDGVQMGVDPQGVPNLVEEGEVVFNDYVFSNRLVVPKAVRKKYKLRDKKGLTFADAAKEVQKESEERPNDPISKRGLEDWMAKLTNEQENVRQKKAMRQLEKQADELGITPEELLAQQAQEQQLQQQLPMDATGMSMPMMSAYGGGIHIKPSKRGTFTAAASKHGMGVQEFASKVLANKDDYSPAMVKKANFAKNAAGWKHGLGGNLYPKGGPMWVAFDTPSYLEHPWWDTEKYTGEESIVLDPKVEMDPTKVQNKAIGEWEEKHAGTPFPTVNNRIVATYSTPKRTLLYDADDEKVTTPYQSYLSTLPTGFKSGKLLPTTGYGRDTSNSWGLDKLRYVPALGSALGVFSDLMGWTNKPDYTNANMIMGAAKNIPDVRYRPIGDYMTYNPLDRMFYMNQANANAAATRRALMNTSGGNWGTARAALLAADANHINSLGQIARQAEEYNLAQREKVANFNRATNMANAENDLKAQMANQNKYQMFLSAAEAAAKMRDAIDARASAGRSANLTNLFDNIGNIGWEEFNRNMVNTSNPYYNIDSSGRVFWTESGLKLTREQKERALEKYGYYRGKSKMNYSPLDNIYTMFR